MLTEGRFEALLGPDRWILAQALRHPAATAGFLLLGKPRLGLYLAQRAALRTQSQPFAPSKEYSELKSVRSLQDYISTAALKSPHLDPSSMRFFKGPFLYFLVRIEKPRMVLETGVASGVSTSYVLQALYDNQRGTLVSIDLPNADPKARLPESMSSGWCVPKGLRQNWVLERGNARLLLPKVLDEHGPFDLFIHDSLHTYEHMTWEYETVWTKLSPSGLLVSDDVIWNNAFADFCRKKLAPEFPSTGWEFSGKEHRGVFPAVPERQSQNSLASRGNRLVSLPNPGGALHS